MKFYTQNYLVSVIMSVYNKEKFISESITAILNQSYKNFELLIIDDHSSDNSIKTIKKFKDKRIKLFINKFNKGRSKNYNFLAKKIKGDFVITADADDILMPYAFEELSKVLYKNKRIDFVYGNLFYFNGNYFLGLENYYKKSKAKFTENDLAYKSIPIPHISMMAKKKWYKDNPYPEDISSAVDQVRYLISLKNSNYISIDTVVVGYRKFRNKISNFTDYFDKRVNYQRHLIKYFKDNKKYYYIIISSIFCSLKILNDFLKIFKTKKSDNVNDHKHRQKFELYIKKNVEYKNYLVK